VNRAVSYNSFPLQLKLNPRQEFQIILSKADIQENVSITTNKDLLATSYSMYNKHVFLANMDVTYAYTKL